MMPERTPEEIELAELAKQNHQLYCAPSQGRTQQNSKDEVDINVIMAKWLKGSPPAMKADGGTYGDYGTALDYQQAQNSLLDAQAQFDALPSQIRQDFENDPQQLLEFVLNPDNQAEAIAMGLIPADPTAPPTPAVDPIPPAEPPVEDPPEGDPPPS